MVETREFTVLVVDDEQVIRDVLSKALSKIPYLKVETAQNGEIAYNTIRHRKPDILYTDVEMPSMPGDKLLERLVQEDVKIPTFVISGTLTNEQGVRAIYYSHRMFTQQQADELQLPISPTIADTKNYIEQQKSKVDEKQRQTDQTIKYDFGFNVLTKPYDLQEIIYKTQIIQSMLQQPQS